MAKRPLYLNPLFLGGVAVSVVGILAMRRRAAPRIGTDAVPKWVQDMATPPTRGPVPQGRSGVRLGKYFTLPEMLASTTARSKGLSNQPPDAEEGYVVANLRALVQNTLDPIREAYGPVQITSAFRSPAVNDAIGGSLRCPNHGFPGNKAPNSATALLMAARTNTPCGSQHLLGEAADFKFVGKTFTSREIAAMVVRLRDQGKVKFDQLVWYDPDQSSHVHISYRRRGTNRNEVLRKTASGYVKQLP